MDYLRYWSLRHSPFHASGRFFFTGAAQRRAIAGVESWVTRGHSFGLLVSSNGQGTTTLLNHLCSNRGFGDCATEFVLTPGGRSQVFRPLDLLAEQLGMGSSANIESSVAAALNASARQSIRTVWLIDQCAEVTATGARRLAKQFQSLTVVAAVGDHVDHRIGIGPRQRISLGPLDLKETQSFIQHSLRAAGCVGKVFSTTSVERIHRWSLGSIKLICQLSEQLLVAAAKAGLRQITSSRELVWPTRKAA